MHKRDFYDEWWQQDNYCYVPHDQMIGPQMHMRNPSAISAEFNICIVFVL